LPACPDSGDLEDKDTIVLEKVINLLKESRVTPDSDVLEIPIEQIVSRRIIRDRADFVDTHLGHLQTDNLVELSRLQVTEIRANDTTLRRIYPILPQPLVSEGGLVSSKSDTGNITVVVLSGESGKGTPTTSDVQELVSRLQIEFFTDKGKLVVLELFEGFKLGWVGDDSGSVDPVKPELS
jgi:hypothetical protein